MISAPHVFKTVGKKPSHSFKLVHAIDFFWKDSKCVYFITVGLKINHETLFSSVLNDA